MDGGRIELVLSVTYNLRVLLSYLIHVLKCKFLASVEVNALKASLQ